MKTDQIMYCIVALILGMLLANMLSNVCGCTVVEGGAGDVPSLITNKTANPNDWIPYCDLCCDGTSLKDPADNRCLIISGQGIPDDNTLMSSTGNCNMCSTNNHN